VILDFCTPTRHCVAYSESNFSLNNNNFSAGVFREGTDLCVVTQYHDTTIGDPGAELYCIHNTVYYTFTQDDSWGAMVCRIPYQSDVTRILLEHTKSYSSALTNNGFSVSQVNISFKTCVTAPVFSFNTTLYANYSHSLYWNDTPGDNRIGYVYKMYCYMRAPGETEFTQNVVFENVLKSRYTYTLEDVPIGTEWYFYLEYRTFDPDTWDNRYYNYTTLCRITTPVSRITRSGNIPLAPTSITAGMLLAGGKVTVSWSAVYDSLLTVTGYTLERSTDGISFTTLYTGTSRQFPDTIPTGIPYIWYRLRTNASNGNSSPWYTTAALPVIQSNVYIGTASGIRRANAIYIGSHKASPMAIVG